MRKFIPIMLIFLLIIPLILSQDSCPATENGKRKICFNKEEQNCLFIKMIPYDIFILSLYYLIYFKNKKKINKFNTKRKIYMGFIAFAFYITAGFILGKIYLFNSCKA